MRQLRIASCAALAAMLACSDRNGPSGGYSCTDDPCQHLTVAGRPPMPTLTYVDIEDVPYAITGALSRAMPKNPGECNVGLESVDVSTPIGSAPPMLQQDIMISCNVHGHALYLQFDFDDVRTRTSLPADSRFGLLEDEKSPHPGCIVYGSATLEVGADRGGGLAFPDMVSPRRAHFPACSAADSAAASATGGLHVLPRQT